MTTLDEIEAGLRLNSFLSEEEVRLRSRLVFEDMQTIGFDLNIIVQSVPLPPFNKTLSVAYYTIPDADFGIENLPNLPDARKAGGAGLNWGDLIRLSKACKIGRIFLRNRWSSFRKKLANGKNHLSHIEELLWLGFWSDVQNLLPEAQPFAGCLKDVDWRFTCCDQTINLEIKYRPKDWIRHVDGAEYSKVFDSYFEDVFPKFPQKNPSELNLVGITSPAAIDRNIRDATERFLKNQVTIDGVILWSLNSHNNVAFEIHSPKEKELIRLLFKGGDKEDMSYIGMIFHPWQDRDRRRKERGPQKS